MLLAYGLARGLAKNSYSELDDGECGNGDRPSDLEVDELLEKLAIAREREVPNWNFVGELKQLEEEAKWLDDYGIEDFCPRTIKLMSAWRDGISQPEIAKQVANARGGSSGRWSPPFVRPVQATRLPLA
jgi:DNA-directed RNA polymerase subunit N (RpoN/RPB10)